MKKVLRSILLISIFILIFVYWIGTQNFYLGSNSSFYSTAFDNENSVWECKEQGLTAYVEEKEDASSLQRYIRIQDAAEKLVALAEPHGDSLIDLCYSTENECIKTVNVKYKKRFGKIIAFELFSDENIFADSKSVAFKLNKN